MGVRAVGGVLPRKADGEVSVSHLRDVLNHKAQAQSAESAPYTHGAHDFIRKILANLGWPTCVTIFGKRAWLTSGNYRLLAHAEGSECLVRGGDSVKAQASQDKGVTVHSVFVTKKRGLTALVYPHLR